MESSFAGLAFGLLFAVLLVYFLIVVNFQSWLDPATRTLLTEVQVPNKDGALRAGLFLQVKFIFQRCSPSVTIPAAALATRSDGPRLAILDAQHRIHYRAVQLGREFGNEIEVVAGLDAGDTVVVRPGDNLPEGAEVEVAPATT